MIEHKKSEKKRKNQIKITNDPTLKAEADIQESQDSSREHCDSQEDKSSEIKSDSKSGKYLKNSGKKESLYKNAILNNHEETETNSNKTHIRAFNDRLEQKSNHNSLKPTCTKNQKTSKFNENDQISNRGALTHNPNISLEFKIPRNYNAKVHLTLEQKDG